LKEADMTKVKRVMALGLAGTLAIGAAIELRAAPAPDHTAAFKGAASGIVTMEALGPLAVPLGLGPLQPLLGPWASSCVPKADDGHSVEITN
jgi:hypothetical protein